MIRDLKLPVKDVRLIVNRSPEKIPEAGIMAEIEARGLSLAGVLPQDDMVYRYDAEGKALITLPVDTSVRKALSEIIRRLKL
jgi:CO dehydrogenase maturation factor